MLQCMRIEQVEQNSARLLKALMAHIQERADIEKLAKLLDYEPTQIETDVEDFVALITEYRCNKNLTKLDF